jgi:ATP-dependent DNA helicase RecG
VHERVLRKIEGRPLSRAELAEALGHKGVSGSLRRALGDLMAVGLVEYTIPDKPGSRLQRYRPGPVRK